MYIIIVGAGDIGMPLIEIATGGGNEVVVIESDESRAEMAASEYDALVLNEDATVKDVLEDAGAGGADAIICTTEQDATNVMGNPQRLIAEHLYRGVKRPSIRDFMRIGEEAEVFEIEVKSDAPIAGKTLVDADADGLLSEDMVVVAVEREGTTDPLTPRGGTVIEAGDLVTIYSSLGAVPEITHIFGHYDDHE
jgi:trk system potassium uptake protein TrkA